MRIRVTIEYEVDPKDYDNPEEILEQEQCRVTAYLGYLWVIDPGPRSSGTSVEIKAEEIK